MHTKDVGIVRITPLIICASSARLDVLTNAGDESDAGSSEGGGGVEFESTTGPDTTSARSSWPGKSPTEKPTDSKTSLDKLW
jgi:hypothetical protein